MLIFYQLLPHCRRWRTVIVVVVGILSSLLVSRLWRLIVEIVIFGVSSSSLFCNCCQRRLFLCLRLSASAPRRHCRRLVFFLSSDSCCWCHRHWVSYRRRSLVVVDVIVGWSSLAAAAASCRCLWRQRCGVL